MIIDTYRSQKYPTFFLVLPADTSVLPEVEFIAGPFVQCQKHIDLKEAIEAPLDPATMAKEIAGQGYCAFRVSHRARVDLFATQIR